MSSTTVVISDSEYQRLKDIPFGGDLPAGDPVPNSGGNPVGGGGNLPAVPAPDAKSSDVPVIPDIDIHDDPFVLPGTPLTPTSGGDTSGSMQAVAATSAGATAMSTAIHEVLAAAAMAPEPGVATAPIPGFLTHDAVLHIAAAAALGGFETSDVDAGSAAAGSAPWSGGVVAHLDDEPLLPLTHGDFGGSEAFWSTWTTEAWSWFDWDSALHQHSSDWFVV